MRYVSVAANSRYPDADDISVSAERPTGPDLARRQSFPCAASLRRELSQRNRIYAQRHQVAFCETYGPEPTICYSPHDDKLLHGNFLPQSYRAIQKNDSWRMRLEKSHTSAKRALPRGGRRWRELDSCISSDALLMNIFCYPGTLKGGPISRLLGVEAGAQPQFGFKARVPLKNGRADRTEVDMKLDSLLVEAKLTESDFQAKSSQTLEAYRDFHAVFEPDHLSLDNGRYRSYQLIRNVLAAYATESSFCVMMDARRPDLREAWFEVMCAIRDHDLRLRCKMITWQELAGILPTRLRDLLDEKYGIIP
jgi:hypothetical protein